MDEIELTAPDANLLVEAGVIYALPRMTGIVSDARSWLTLALPTLGEETRQAIIEALRLELSRQHQSLWHSERHEWTDILGWLDTLPEPADQDASCLLPAREMYALLVAAARHGMACRSETLQRQYAAACARYAPQLTADEQRILIRDIDEEFDRAARVSFFSAPVEEWRMLAEQLRAASV